MAQEKACCPVEVVGHGADPHGICPSTLFYLFLAAYLSLSGVDMSHVGPLARTHIGTALAAWQPGTRPLVGVVLVLGIVWSSRPLDPGDRSWPPSHDARRHPRFHAVFRVRVSAAPRTSGTDAAAKPVQDAGSNSKEGLAGSGQSSKRSASEIARCIAAPVWVHASVPEKWSDLDDSGFGARDHARDVGEERVTLRKAPRTDI
ncbi:Uu.00g107300.m01.CDS01 [Anthostomella pinea]|uniref:Uu.00g107300.m01.CDS01 n=1 Tax=Anthostomella pinea TaxID=933095 RepID=A0AAI8VE65_9PEZI|nr:Uu.00g107300.m01.CDS01 [Anthostomella pinea]